MHDSIQGDFKTITAIKDKDLNNLIGSVKGTREITRSEKVYLM